MIKKIKDITLLNVLGKGAFGTVYLSRKDGKNEFYATKMIDRAMADKPSYFKYFENELRLLKELHHPNIVHLEDIQRDDKYYYIVMEYVNGGSLTDCLKKYKSKYGKAFPEDIVQYLMKQIVDAIKYIHQRNIIHRDLKLDNIMVKFNSDNDKNNLFLTRATIKIIDFGFATKLTPDKNNLAQTVLGSPINMDPLILNEMAKRGKKINQIGYDQKADIWSLGTICYEMKIGHPVFDAQTMEDLIQKVEQGDFNVPSTVSEELVDFLNGMLRYEGEKRFSIEELAVHPFLIKDVRNFKFLNMQARKKKNISGNGLNLNVKVNKTIWGIYDDEAEKKLIGINHYGNRNNMNKNQNVKPIPEVNQDMHRKYNTNKDIPRMNLQPTPNKNYIKSNSNNDYPSFGPSNQINQYPNANIYPGMAPFQYYPGYYYGGMPGFNAMIPTFNPSPSTFNQIQQIQQMQQMQQMKQIQQMKQMQQIPQYPSQGKGYTSNYYGPYPPNMNRQTPKKNDDWCGFQ